MATRAPLFRADVIQAMSLASGDPPLTPDDPTYAWRFLAEGDSWFTLGAIPSSNLLFELRLRKSAVILNLGYPGDTISHMSQLASNTEFARRLANPNWASNWDAILLSGGGNDLIDQAEHILHQAPPGGGAKADDFVDFTALDRLQDDIKDGYRRMVALRDSAASPNKNKPFIVHTYDYATPRPAPATFLFAPITKPWMHSIFERYQIPKAMRIPIADLLVNALAKTLLELAKALPAFYVVKTLNTLERANIESKGNSGDWLNEIHPNSDGYRKIAAKIASQIHKVLGA